MERESRYKCWCCHISTGLRFVGIFELLAAGLALFALVVAWQNEHLVGIVPTPIIIGAILLCCIKLISPFILFAGIHYKSQKYMIAYSAGCVAAMLISFLLGAAYILMTGKHEGSPAARVATTMGILVGITLVLMYELYLAVRMLKLLDKEEKRMNRRCLSIRRQNQRVEKELEQERLKEINGLQNGTDDYDVECR